MKGKITFVLSFILIVSIILCILIILAKNHMLEEFFGGHSNQSNHSGNISRSSRIGGYKTIGSGGSNSGYGYSFFPYPYYNTYYINPKACTKKEDCNSKNCLKSGVCSPV
jgi:hypothetical protein